MPIHQYVYDCISVKTRVGLDAIFLGFLAEPNRSLRGAWIYPQ
jgi:hypothetical protein